MSLPCSLLRADHPRRVNTVNQGSNLFRMSATRNKSPSEDPHSLRHRSSNANVVVEARDYTSQIDMSPLAPFHKKSISSSLDGIRIHPRVPTGSPSNLEDVELSLLSEEERISAGRNLQDGDARSSAGGAKTTAMSSRDKKAMTLLIILCRSLSYLRAFNSVDTTL